jgi:hypothetical protein
MPRAEDPHLALEQTTRFWRGWSERCQAAGPYTELVRRSLITLKALTYAPTGGIVAAPTTSLPEEPGGERNWDYRFCWLRDATFTLLALMNAGYFEEAAAGDPAQAQIMYGIGGERRLPEWSASWLAGYRGSQPVRVGNAAAQQLQLDVFGEVLEALDDPQSHPAQQRQRRQRRRREHEAEHDRHRRIAFHREAARKRHRARHAVDVAGEHLRGAELAERPRPAQQGAAAQGRQHHRHGHRPEAPPRSSAQRGGDGNVPAVEAAQAGVFQIRNVPEPDMGPLLGIACPNTLFPYARETISMVTARAGFQPVILAPMSFENIYQQQLEQMQAPQGSRPN